MALQSAIRPPSSVASCFHSVSVPPSELRIYTVYSTFQSLQWALMSRLRLTQSTSQSFQAMALQSAFRSPFSVSPLFLCCLSSEPRIPIQSTPHSIFIMDINVTFKTQSISQSFQTMTLRSASVSLTSVSPLFLYRLSFEPRISIQSTPHSSLYNGHYVMFKTQTGTQSFQTMSLQSAFRSPSCLHCFCAAFRTKNLYLLLHFPVYIMGFNVTFKTQSISQSFQTMIMQSAFRSPSSVSPLSLCCLSSEPRIYIIIIMYIYHALINALSAHMIHINLNKIFYTHVEHSPTKIIYIR